MADAGAPWSWLRDEHAVLMVVDSVSRCIVLLEEKRLGLRHKSQDSGRAHSSCGNAVAVFLVPGESGVCCPQTRFANMAGAMMCV